jgi:hypothetical protein
MAFERDWKFTSAVLLCLVMGTFTVRILLSLFPTEAEQNKKLLGLVTIFSFVSGIVAFFLTMYVFGANPTYMMMFLVLVTLLLYLLSMLSSSVATTQLNDMRVALSNTPA